MCLRVLYVLQKILNVCMFINYIVSCFYYIIITINYIEQNCEMETLLYTLPYV
jgi:hypothetical protein